MAPTDPPDDQTADAAPDLESRIETAGRALPGPAPGPDSGPAADVPLFLQSAAKPFPLGGAWDTSASAKDADEATKDIATVKQATKDDYQAFASSRKDQQQSDLPYQTQQTPPSSPVGDLRRSLSGMVNPLMWLGILAAGQGRRGAINAMSAMTGMFEGLNAGKLELAKLHEKKFQGSVNSLVGETLAQNMRYNEMFNSGKNPAEIIADVTGYASSIGDTTMADAGRRADLGQMHDIVKGRGVAANDILEKTHKTKKSGTADEATTAARASEPDPLYEDEAQRRARGDTTAGKGLGQKIQARIAARAGKIRETLTPEERQSQVPKTAMQQRFETQQTQGKKLAEGIKNGTVDPNLSGINASAKTAAEAALVDEGFDLPKAKLEYAAAQRQVASMNSAQMLKYRSLGKTISLEIDEVNRLSALRQQGGIQALNRTDLEWLSKFRSETPEGQLAARYLSAIGLLKENFANMAQGGGVPTEPAWELANVQINGNYGQLALEASLKEVQKMINMRRSVLGEFAGGQDVNRYVPTLRGGGGGGAPSQDVKTKYGLD